MEKKRCPACFLEFDSNFCPHCGEARNDSHQLPIGTLLRDRYLIGKVLGQGGFGITYLAWDTLMQRNVAVKEFFPAGTVFRRSELSTRVECGTNAMIPHYEYSRERFLREASALVKFQDIPEVVGIYDFVKENNTAYIVMEYVRGVDLAKYIQRKGGRLGVEETFRILKPVMEALAKVHKAGIVHRDISPDNIILDPMGGAKLLDFGAVRAVENPDVDKGLNKSTEAILKQGFAPLEQYNSRGSLGPWTDEYAMCATVWYCLTGTIPEEASLRMVEGIDPDWSTIPGLPEHQQKALQKGISCRARDRYADMDSLLADLFPPKEIPQPAPRKVEVPVEEARKEPRPEKIIPAEAPRKMPESEKKAPEDVKRQRKRLKYAMLAAAAAAAILLIVLLLALIPKPKAQIWDPSKEDPNVPTIIYSEPTTEATEPATEETEPAAEETEPAAEPPSEEDLYLQAEKLLEQGEIAKSAIAFGKLGDYSDARERSFALWDQVAVRETVSAGNYHTVGLRSDGTVEAVGRNVEGQCNVFEWTDIIAVSAGGFHTVGLRSDGTVVAVGTNELFFDSGSTYSGHCDVSEWTDIVAISAGENITIALRIDGTVVAAGYNSVGQTQVSKWADMVAVDAGMNYSMGLRADGTVVTTGWISDDPCDVSVWSDIVAISAGGWHVVGLRKDGTVVAVGLNNAGQCDLSDWTGITAISASGNNTVGLWADGTVEAIGFYVNDQCNAWTNIEAISVGWGHVVGLRADGTLTAAGSNEMYQNDRFCYSGQLNVASWRNIMLPKHTINP